MTTTINHKRRRRGAALLWLLAFLAFFGAGGGVFVTYENAKQLARKQKQLNERADKQLNNAASALSHYALNRADNPLPLHARNIIPPRLLTLPCPDNAGNYPRGDGLLDGFEDASCGGRSRTSILDSGARFGLLPWRKGFLLTLFGNRAATPPRAAGGLGYPFADGIGNQYWYAVAYNVAPRERQTVALNLHRLANLTSGWLTVAHVQRQLGGEVAATVARVAGVVIAPGLGRGERIPPNVLATTPIIYNDPRIRTNLFLDGVTITATAPTLTVIPSYYATVVSGVNLPLVSVELGTVAPAPATEEIVRLRNYDNNLNFVVAPKRGDFDDRVAYLSADDWWRENGDFAKQYAAKTGVTHIHNRPLPASPLAKIQAMVMAYHRLLGFYPTPAKNTDTNVNSATRHCASFNSGNTRATVTIPQSFEVLAVGTLTVAGTVNSVAFLAHNTVTAQTRTPVTIVNNDTNAIIPTNGNITLAHYARVTAITAELSLSLLASVTASVTVTSRIVPLVTVTATTSVQHINPFVTATVELTVTNLQALPYTQTVTVSGTITTSVTPFITTTITASAATNPTTTSTVSIATATATTTLTGQLITSTLISQTNTVITTLTNFYTLSLSAPPLIVTNVFADSLTAAITLTLQTIIAQYPTITVAAGETITLMPNAELLMPSKTPLAPPDFYFGWLPENNTTSVNFTRQNSSVFPQISSRAAFMSPSQVLHSPSPLSTLSILLGDGSYAVTIAPGTRIRQSDTYARLSSPDLELQLSPNNGGAVTTLSDAFPDAIAAEKRQFAVFLLADALNWNTRSSSRTIVRAPAVIYPWRKKTRTSAPSSSRDTLQPYPPCLDARNYHSENLGDAVTVVLPGKIWQNPADITATVDTQIPVNMSALAGEFLSLTLRKSDSPLVLVDDSSSITVSFSDAFNARRGALNYFINDHPIHYTVSGDCLYGGNCAGGITVIVSDGATIALPEPLAITQNAIGIVRDASNNQHTISINNGAMTISQPVVEIPPVSYGTLMTTELLRKVISRGRTIAWLTNTIVLTAASSAPSKLVIGGARGVFEAHLLPGQTFNNGETVTISAGTPIAPRGKTATLTISGGASVFMSDVKILTATVTTTATTVTTTVTTLFTAAIVTNALIIDNVRALMAFSPAPLPRAQCGSGALANIITAATTATIADQTALANTSQLTDLCAWLDDAENNDGDNIYRIAPRKNYPAPLSPANDFFILFGGKPRL